MKVFLRVLCGVPESYYSRDRGKHFQGVVWGSSTALALWMITLIFLAWHLYSKDLSTQMPALALETMMPLAALIFINDANLRTFNSESDVTDL